MHVTDAFGNYPVFLQIDYLERTAGNPVIPALTRRDIVEIDTIVRLKCALRNDSM